MVGHIIYFVCCGFNNPWLWVLLLLFSAALVGLLMLLEIMFVVLIFDLIRLMSPMWKSIGVWSGVLAVLA